MLKCNNGILITCLYVYSLEGYTSISVREPLEHIRGATHTQSHDPQLDPHYATVSDDSDTDNMYAAIVDPETYARVHALPPPVTVAEVHGEEAADTAPAAPRHSRQASASSVAGSPKPEKRQANSPLPPPPAVGAAGAVGGTDKHRPPNNNLEDMYAKVHKSTKRRGRQGDVPEADESTPPPHEHCYETLANR